MTNEKTRRRGLQIIEETTGDVDIIVYTDGSVTDGQKGGAGIVMYRKDEVEPFKQVSIAAGKFCISGRAEMTAIREALKILTETDNWSKASILTDSKSSIQTIDRQLGSFIWHLVQELNNEEKKVNIQWIPAQCDLQGNEMADELAKQGGQMNQDECQISLEIAKGRIKQSTRERKQRKETFINRLNETKIHQLRTGHSFLLKSYKHR